MHIAVKITLNSRQLIFNSVMYIKRIVVINNFLQKIIATKLRALRVFDTFE